MKCRLRIRLFGARFPGADGSWAGPTSCELANFGSSKRATNPYRSGRLRPPLRRSQSGLFPALQGSGALLYAARREPMGVALFLGSSAVEHSTVNRMVAGSNPARGAKHFQTSIIFRHRDTDRDARTQPRLS